MTGLIEVFSLVHGVFNDLDKTRSWLHTENPLLGNTTPVSMMLSGRSKKLLACVKSLTEGNAP